MDTQSLWLNTNTYSALQLAFMFCSRLAWIVLYATIVRNIRRHEVVEIPAQAAAANAAFLTVWVLLHQPDLGRLFVFIDRGALLLVLGVFAYVIANGARHIRIPELREWFRPGMVLSYFCWLAMLATFVSQRYDASTGVVSGFIVSLVMSTMYVVVELEDIDPEQYSLVAAWAKLIANGAAAVFCVTMYPANYFLLTLCAITLALDLTYLMLFRQRRLSQPGRVPA